MAKDKRWMQRAFSKRRGSLHRALHVPQGQKIPSEKLEEAKEGKFGKKVEKKAIPVVTAKKINAKHGKKKHAYKR